MAKVDWGNLEFVEEWTPIDPSNPDATIERKEQLEVLSRLVLQIYFSMKKGKSAKLENEKGAA